MSLNTIANLASGRKVLSKAKMFPIVRDVIKASVHTASNEDLADIYNFFMPTPDAKPKTVEAWIAKALGNNEFRLYCKYLYSDGNRLVGTDGHRLHVTNKTDLAPGYYDKALERIDKEIQYPNIDRVIPNGKGITVTKGNLLSGEIRAVSDKIEAIKVSNGTDDAWVNRRYLNQALSGFSDDCVQLLITSPHVRTYQYHQITTLDKAIRIEQGDRLAVIMPIRES